MLISDEVFNHYKIMWVFVFFDLPVQTKKQRHAAQTFRKTLLKDGFTMFQYSIYIRHSMSRENAQVHIDRVKKALPKEGHIVLFSLTDKQFGDIEIFHGSQAQKLPKVSQQLMMF